MGSFSARPALYLSGIHVHRKAIVTTHSPNTPEPQTTPLAARIRLAHAYFQRMADMHSIDILHVKGYAFSQEIYRKGRYSSDTDLLIRPSHVDRFVEILLADGWRIQAHFETGSVFEHAMTLYHASWGLTDIHRFFPGLGRHGDYEKAFDRVWAARKTRMIAHHPCAVPSDLDARLLVVLHRARAASRYSADINYLVSLLSYSDWQRLRARAEELDSSLAYSAAMGGLEQYRDDRDYLLWLSVSQDVPHYIQWIGRLQSATTLHDKLRTLKNIFLVNKDHLAMQLGRTPTKAEIRAKFSPTATYLANLANGELSVLQDSASIIWSIFEDPMSLQDAIDALCEMYEQPVEIMGPQIAGFIPELLSKGLLEAR